MGRPADAVREIQRAVEIDPEWANSNEDLIIALNYAGRYEDARKQAEHTLSLDPGQASSESLLGYVYLREHRFDEAIAAFQRGKRSPATTQTWTPASGLAYAYAVSGRRAEALKELGELEKQVDLSIHTPVNIAGVYAGLGDKDRALAMLERAYQHRYPRIWHLKLDQRFESLHSDPRFKDLLRRIGMPE
jgi:Flp pilus assembly protein TadD